MSELLEKTFSEREQAGREKWDAAQEARRAAAAAQLEADLEKAAQLSAAARAAEREREIEKARAKAEKEAVAAHAQKYGDDRNKAAFSELAAALAKQSEKQRPETIALDSVKAAEKNDDAAPNA